MQATGELSVRDQQRLIAAMLKDDDDMSLYALNVSDKPDAYNRPTDMAGDIHFLVTPTGSQQEQSIRLPSTYVPLDLTAQGQADKKAILRSIGFQRMLAAKRIQVIATSAALAIIEKDSASREEFSRMQARACRIFDDSQDELAAAALHIDEEPINPNLIQAVESYHRGGRMADLINARRKLGGAITDADIRYLTKEVPSFVL